MCYIKLTEITCFVLEIEKAFAITYFVIGIAIELAYFVLEIKNAFAVFFFVLTL